MKRFLSVFLPLIFSLLFFEVSAQSYFLTADSLNRYPNYLNKKWKYSQDDNLSMSSSDYDDSRWTQIKTSLDFSDSVKFSFDGIGWFRLNLIADSSVVGIPLAMTVTHFGASEIYIDGKLIQSNGNINGPDSSIYFDPREVPIIFIIQERGKHVLAVRYANYAAKSNLESYNQNKAGFKMMIGNADHYIFIKNQRSLIITFMVMLLGGIFISLGVVHLFLFFYHKADRSNLFFSLFMFSISTLFIIGFIGYSSTTPSLVLKSLFIINSVIVVACVSLSGFIRELFVKSKIRLIIISLIGLISLITQYLGIIEYAYVTIALIITVSFEAVFTIIFGMIKRVKGAGIIGTGILFFTLIILTLFTTAIASGGNFDINDSTMSGFIWECLITLAVISIPVSMSLYQAWRFSRVNKVLALQLDQVKILSQKTLEQELEKKKILESQKEKLEEEVLLRTAELREEKQKSDDLLLNILPAEVAAELKEKGSADAKHFDEVTVLFTDFKNFTKVSEQMTPQQLVNEINYCYSEFDKIISSHGIEKIKTIGDAYMCAGGLPVPSKTNALDTVNAAFGILNFMSNEYERRKTAGKTFFEIRIGIHTGSVVAGIVGIKKFAYDIWGDTVNIASRMESSGETGKINVSGSTHEQIKNKFHCTYRGKIEAKNKGEIDMYFVDHEL